MASPQPPIRVGIIGLGFMGATHLLAYQSAQCGGYPVKVVAVCDPKARRRAGDLSDTGGNIKTGGDHDRAFDPAEVRGYEQADELLADPNVDLVSVCTRTDTHVDLSIKALAAGKHVLVEKPIAVKPGDVRRLADAARPSDRICMPAMCIRYWPAYAHLARCIRDGSLGAVRSATFQRLAAGSTSRRDASITGGALIDLHIHDADFVWWTFGNPAAVDSAGWIEPSGGVDHVTTQYRYPAGRGPTHVVAEGGWDHAATFAYRMRFVVVFERGTLDFDLTRTPHPLLLCTHERSEPVSLPDGQFNGYDLQARALLDALAGKGDARSLPTVAEAVAVTELLTAEVESVRRAERVTL